MRFRQKFLDFLRQSEPETVIAVFRVFFGLILLANFVLIGLDLEALFTGTGLLTEKARSIISAQPSLGAWLGAGYAASWLHAAGILASIFLTLGVSPRLSALVVFLVLVSYQRNNQAAFWSGDDGVMRAFALYLVFSTSLGRYSVSKYLRPLIPALTVKFTQLVTERWLFALPITGWRLIQFQLMLIYATNFVAKILQPEWRDGTAIYYVSRFTDYQRFYVPFLFDYLISIRILSYLTLAIELGLALFLFLPLKVRPWILASGFFLHLSMEYALNIPLFQWLMMAGLITLLPECRRMDNVTGKRA